MARIAGARYCELWRFPTWWRPFRNVWQALFPVPATNFDGPDGSAPGPAWSVPAPSDDLVSRDAPRRHDEHAPRDREVQRLSDVNLA